MLDCPLVSSRSIRWLYVAAGGSLTIAAAEIDVVNIKVGHSAGKSRIVLPVADSNQGVALVLVCIIEVAAEDLRCRAVVLAVGIVGVSCAEVEIVHVDVKVAPTAKKPFSAKSFSMSSF